MLFVVTQKHGPKECPADHTGAQMLSGDAKKVGVKVSAVYRCGPAHTLYYVVEADDMGKIESFLAPGMDRCTAEISPVVQMV